MSDRMEHFDEDVDLRVPPRLSAELNALFEPPALVPPEVDRAILDRAAKHFVRPALVRGIRRHLRWAGLWKVAAAAAVVILAFSLDLSKRVERTGEHSGSSVERAVDIDRNGRVDILDAFKLARQIETAGTTEQAWDVNHDGLVDRHDVDMVAFAAVRLDKGVL